MKPFGYLAYGKGMSLKHDLIQPETILGRSETCDIQVVDPYVSRRQARIVKDDGRIILENIGRNPVLVNGEAVRKKTLQSGDMLLFGKTHMVFQRLPEAPEAPSVVGEPNLDPEMTFLLPEHRTLERMDASAPATRLSRNMLLAWIALGLILLAVVLFVFF